MKTQIKPLIRFLPLLALVSAPHLASAYYDPAVQRWINRDPVQDAAFQNRTSRHPRTESHRGNLCCFIDNGPIGKRDLWGLIVFDGCSQDDKNKINKAIDDNCAKAKKCGLDCPSRGPYKGVAALCDYSKDFKVSCRDNDSEGCADKAGKRGPCGSAGGSDGPGSITLCRRAFDKDTCDGLECTLFHEALHSPGGMSGFPHTQEHADFDKCMGCSVNYSVGK